MTDLDELTDFACNPPLPKNKAVGIGCIGSGFIMADCQLPAYREAGLNPVAIASRTLANAQAVADRHKIPNVYADYNDLLANPAVEVLDIAVPPDAQLQIIRDAVQHADHIRGILAQKPLGMNANEALEIIELCESAGIELAVNQNMRFDQSIRAAKKLLDDGVLGRPVLATIDMRAIPHWMPWQERLGWVTCRIMSIHHLDTFRYWLGEAERIYASFAPDPRTSESFEHEDGVCLYTLKFPNGVQAASWDDVWAGPAREGAASDLGINWRLEGTKGMARGTIGWPSYPERTPSTIDFTTIDSPEWHKPRWDKVWFPDAFIGPMADLLCALETNQRPANSGRDNLGTMTLVDAAYQSARTHQACVPQRAAGPS